MDLITRVIESGDNIIETLPDLNIDDVEEIENAIKLGELSKAAQKVIEKIEGSIKAVPSVSQPNLILLKRFTKCITEIGWKEASSFGNSVENILASALQLNILGGDRTDDEKLKSHFYNHASNCAKFLRGIKSEDQQSAKLYKYIELACLFKSINISKKCEDASYVISQYSILIDLLLSFKNPSFKEDKEVVEILKINKVFSWGEKIPCFLFASALDFVSKKEEEGTDRKKVFRLLCRTSNKIAGYCRTIYDGYTRKWLDDIPVQTESLIWYKLSVKYHLAAIAINSFFSTYSEADVVSSLNISLEDHIEILRLNTEEDNLIEEVWGDQNLSRFVNQDLSWITQRINAIIEYAGASFQSVNGLFTTYKSYIDKIKSLIETGTKKYNSVKNKSSKKKKKKKK